MKKTRILKAGEIRETLERMALRVARDLSPPESLVLVGVHRQGVPLAHRLAAALRKHFGFEPPIGILDITLYRDDLDTVGHRPVVRGTRIDVPLDDQNVLLVDDILYTGRTVRAALDQLVDFGRPATIRLAVLADRGHRELPIQPDYVGRKVKTRRNQTLKLLMQETDGQDALLLLDPEG